MASINVRSAYCAAPVVGVQDNSLEGLLVEPVRRQSQVTGHRPSPVPGLLESGSTAAPSDEERPLKGALHASGRQSLLPERVVLISGGTAGLGAGIARAAAREGATVAVSGRRREPGDALVAELRAAGTKALFVEADMGEVAQARAFAAAAIAEFGRVDSLVNAAGLTSRGTLLDTTPELFDAHIAVNLKAPFFGLNIGWTDTEGEDVTQRRFHGADVDWRAKVGASLPMGKLGQVGEIAEFVVFLLSDRSGVVSGSVIDWDQNVLGGMD